MKVKFIILILAVALVSSCSSPSKDAEKVCKCLEGVIELAKAQADENAIEAKYSECEKMAEEFEAKYKDDQAKLDEFNNAGKACAEKLEEPM